MDDLHTFVSQLLQHPPGAPKSVHLEFDTEDGPVGLFEALLTIMTDILKAWYVPPIHLGRVNEKDYARLKQYFASFGIRFRLDAEDEPTVVRIDNREYERKSRLQDMTFKMMTGGKLYTVRFDFL
jgi:hypothetical protein